MKKPRFQRIWEVTLRCEDFAKSPPHTDWTFIGEAKTAELAIQKARQSAKRQQLGEAIEVKLVKDCGARDF